MASSRLSHGVADHVARPVPATPVRGRRVYALTPQSLHPVVRIAHRLDGWPLNVPWRVIVDHELVLILQGTGQFQFDDGTMDFRAGHLFLVPPFRPHRIVADDGVVCDHVAIHFDLAPHAPPVEQKLTERQPYEVRLPGRMSLPRRTLLRQRDPIERTMLRLVDLPKDHPLFDVEASVSVLEVLLELWKRAAPSDTDADALSTSTDARDQLRIERAMQLIETNYMRHLDADDLAEAAGMSASHFNRLFRTWTGHSPMEYLRRHRVARARELLADVDLSIKEIARRVGFDDAFHFSKVFHKIDGLSPTQFRDAVLGGKGTATSDEAGRPQA